MLRESTSSLAKAHAWTPALPLPLNSCDALSPLLVKYALAFVINLLCSRTSVSCSGFIFIILHFKSLLPLCSLHLPEEQLVVKKVVQFEHLLMISEMKAKLMDVNLRRRNLKPDTSLVLVLVV
jgi:hypothetical protein